MVGTKRIANLGFPRFSVEHIYKTPRFIFSFVKALWIELASTLKHNTLLRDHCYALVVTIFDLHTIYSEWPQKDTRTECQRLLSYSIFLFQFSFLLSVSLLFLLFFLSFLFRVHIIQSHGGKGTTTRRLEIFWRRVGWPQTQLLFQGRHHQSLTQRRPLPDAINEALSSLKTARDVEIDWNEMKMEAKIY